MIARILIADDYADNRELLRLLLETEGYQVREARNGRELVELARREPPDLALVDLSMPELDANSAPTRAHLSSPVLPSPLSPPKTTAAARSTQASTNSSPNHTKRKN